jgi:Na+-transporting methylmalonyl-CoA/oxaloacetate decarboxylase gamma subunit
MWEQAIRVAIVGFSVVFAGLWMLALGVKIMSFFCRMGRKKTSASQGSVQS